VNYTRKLRDSTQLSHVQSKFHTLWGKLLDIDEKHAESYLDWFLEMVGTNNKHAEELALKRKLKAAASVDVPALRAALSSVKPKGHPVNISKGDIVRVRFGINVADEFSDLRSDFTMNAGHYAIVLAQKGFMFLVLPMTSHSQPSQNPDLVMTVDTTNIPGEDVGHVVFSQRISRIPGFSDGKYSITAEEFAELDEKLGKYLVIKYAIHSV
jgi:hypothetical protein